MKTCGIFNPYFTNEKPCFEGTWVTSQGYSAYYNNIKTQSLGKIWESSHVLPYWYQRNHITCPESHAPVLPSTQVDVFVLCPLEKSGRKISYKIYLIRFSFRTKNLAKGNKPNDNKEMTKKLSPNSKITNVKVWCVFVRTLQSCISTQICYLHVLGTILYSSFPKFTYQPGIFPHKHI